MRFGGTADIVDLTGLGGNLETSQPLPEKRMSHRKNIILSRVKLLQGQRNRKRKSRPKQGISNGDSREK